MKPSGVYIHGPQFFGMFVPGAIWTLSGLLLTSDLAAHSTQLLLGIAPVWVNVVAFVFVSFIIGHTLDSFRTIGRLCEWLPLVQRNVLWRLARLECRVRQLLQRKYSRHPHVRHILGEVRIHTSRNGSAVLFGYVKRALQEPTPAFRRHLAVKEEEMNLLGEMPVPLLGLALVTAIVAVHPNGLFTLFSWELAGLGLSAALVAFAFFKRFSLARVRERIECYEEFLWLHTLGPKGNQNSTARRRQRMTRAASESRLSMRAGDRLSG